MKAKTYRKRLREAIFEVLRSPANCLNCKDSKDLPHPVVLESSKDTAENIFVAVWKVIQEHDSDDE